MARKSNWSRIKKQDVTDTARYRNVYENQQLERSKIEEKQTMTTRTIGSVVLSVLIFFVMYILISLVTFGVDCYSNMNGSSETSGASGGTVTDDKLTVEDLYESSGVDVPDEYRTDDAESDDTASQNSSYIDMNEFNTQDSAYDTYDAQNGVQNNGNEQYESTEKEDDKVFSDYFAPNIYNVGISFLVSFIFFLAFYQFMQRNLMAQNLMNDTADINQYQDDQHIALPEEVQLRYDWFPDVGAHSSVQVSSMISHMALKNKGIKPIMVPERADADSFYEDG